MTQDFAFILQVATSITTLVALVFGMYVAKIWLQGRRQGRRVFRVQTGALDDPPIQPESDVAGPEGGGYILLELPEAQKPLFHDLLKGFEDYAGLRGYRIQFSVDGSVANRIAFKFTIMEPGIGVSTTQVKHDLQEYIRKVQRGDSLDDLPMVLPEQEHNALLLAMKNRISFLQHTYAAQKNVIGYYEATLRHISRVDVPIMPSQTFYLQSGGSPMSQDQYHFRQGGAIGPNASATNFSQLWQESKNEFDLPKLADELQRLRTALRPVASTPEHDVVLGAVAEAESAARSGDGAGVLQHLKKAGKWAFDTATAIGVRVAAAAITKAGGS